MRTLRKLVYSHGLTTVCREAQCPNRGECASTGTVTLMILGSRCTRDCGFCAVASGKPSPPDPDEPSMVAQCVRRMGARHAVITSVTRDDLADGGAEAFFNTTAEIRRTAPGVDVELLIPDFSGNTRALDRIIAARPDVVGHNIETVPRLYPSVRKGADYDRSLGILRRLASSGQGIVTKSGMMVGLGDTDDEVAEVIGNLAGAGCQILTIGQYLRPGEAQVPVKRIVDTLHFQEIARQAEAAGIGSVMAGPLVRSSYRAAEALGQIRERKA